ncbi:MAG: hypothetical protein JNL68_20085 [Burkholderiales bacterium]|nr:hypothetical protein [Burkholderiales bacterium]
MSSSSDDLGLVQVLLDDLEKHTLPRALEVKEKVDRGELLDDFDQIFLRHAIETATRADEVMTRHAEYQALAARVAHLYHEITTRALQNARQP